MIAFAPSVLLALCPPQSPDDVLAEYTLRGQPATITRRDVALEMAFHLRRQDRGREACDMLVDALLTRREAEKHDLMPSKAEVQAFWRKLRQQLIAAGKRPEEFAAVRNTGEQQWLDDLSVQLAQERLVRRELGLDANERVGGDMLRLWLGELRKRFDVCTDPDRLPIGTAVRVERTNVPLIELGYLLLRTSEDFERDKFIRQVAYLESIEALAADRGLSVSQSDLDRAVAERRRAAAKDPAYRGISFDKLLEAKGLSIASLRELRTFRAHILLEKLGRLEFPDGKLMQQLVEDRDALLAHIGPARRIGIILARALDTPNALVTRNFEQAGKHLEKVRERIASDGFAATAAIESEHGPSKQRGGDVGWHRADSDKLPAAVVQAAFALKLGEVSMPIRGQEGCYLVTVLDKQPMPSDQELLERLRALRTQQLSERLLRDANVRIVAGAAGAK
ncbi:MAG TPA: hypothetical protein ENI87_05520 [bacterium]|nr:hypothetical protein [bacterium]